MVSLSSGLEGGAGQGRPSRGSVARLLPAPCLHRRVPPPPCPTRTALARTGVGEDRGAGAARGCAPRVQQQERPEQAAARTVHPSHWPPHEILHPGSCWPPGCAAPPHQLRVSGQFSACLTGEQNMGGGGMQGARADGWAAGVGRAGPDGGPGPRQQRPGRGTGPVGQPGTRPGRRRHLNGDDAAGGGRDMVQPSLARILPGLPVGWEGGGGCPPPAWKAGMAICVLARQSCPPAPHCSYHQFLTDS